MGISFKQKLSEDFIREFSDEVLWGEISSNQVLSRSFKYLMYDKIFIDEIILSSNPKEVI